MKNTIVPRRLAFASPVIAITAMLARLFYTDGSLIICKGVANFR